MNSSVYFLNYTNKAKIIMSISVLGRDEIKAIKKKKDKYTQSQRWFFFFPWNAEIVFVFQTSIQPYNYKHFVPEKIPYSLVDTLFSRTTGGQALGHFLRKSVVAFYQLWCIRMTLLEVLLALSPPGKRNELHKFWHQGFIFFFFSSFF